MKTIEQEMKERMIKALQEGSLSISQYRRLMDAYCKIVMLTVEYPDKKYDELGIEKSSKKENV